MVILYPDGRCVHYSERPQEIDSHRLAYVSFSFSSFSILGRLGIRMRSQHLIELHTISAMQCIARDTLSYPVKVAAGMGNHPRLVFLGNGDAWTNIQSPVCRGPDLVGSKDFRLTWIKGCPLCSLNLERSRLIEIDEFPIMNAIDSKLALSVTTLVVVVAVVLVVVPIASLRK